MKYYVLCKYLIYICSLDIKKTRKRYLVNKYKLTTVVKTKPGTQPTHYINPT